MWRVIALASAGFCLAACGGGSGSPPPTPPSTLSLSTNALTFTATSTTQTPPSQTVQATVTGVTEGTLFIRVDVTGAAVQSVTNVTTTGPTTGQATIVPASASVLGGGTHSGTITVTACTTNASCTSGLVGTPQTINVTYRVHGGTLSAVPPFAIGNAPLAADLARQSVLNLFIAENWSASTSAPWLTVNTLTGSASGTTPLSLSLAQPQLDALNNGSYSASLVVTPTIAAPISTPVTLTIARTQTNFVAPNVATANTTSEVIIRGENYNVPITAIKFGSVDATTYHVVSSTEIRATHPNLAAGRYSVQLIFAAPINRSLAELVVVNPPNFGSSAIAYSAGDGREIYDVVYDAERETLLTAVRYPTMGAAASEILRYRFSGTWNIDARRTLRNVSSLALTPDGRMLLAATSADGVSGGSIVQLDPVTLSIAATTSADFISAARIAPTNDGKMLFVGNSGVISSYFVATRAISAMLGTIGSGTVAASSDGSSLLLGGNSGSGNRYDSSTGIVSTFATNLSPHTISIDRTGSRFAFVDPAASRAYTIANAPLCNFPISTSATIVSPNGQRAYVVDGNALLRTYDLTAAPSVGNCPEIGSGTTLSRDPGVAGRVMLAITPDGGTIFIVGSLGFVVQPAP